MRGQWVAYHSDEPNGDRIWKMSIEGGPPIAITNKEARHPVFSPDGKHIACLLHDNGKEWRLAVFSLDGQIEKSFSIATAVAEQWSGPKWMPDGQALTYIVTHGGISNIWVQPLTGGPPRQLTKFDQDQIFTFAWSSDGKKLACVRGTNVTAAILIKDLAVN